jgi:hypothetical protein
MMGKPASRAAGAPAKALVKMRALVQRINRILAPSGERLRKSRPGRERAELGDYFLFDTNADAIVRHHVDPEALGRETGALKGWEAARGE